MTASASMRSSSVSSVIHLDTQTRSKSREVSPASSAPPKYKQTTTSDARVSPLNVVMKQSSNKRKTYITNKRSKNKNKSRAKNVYNFNSKGKSRPSRNKSKVRSSKRKPKVVETEKSSKFMICVPKGDNNGIIIQGYGRYSGCISQLVWSRKNPVVKLLRENLVYNHGLDNSSIQNRSDNDNMVYNFTVDKPPDVNFVAPTLPKIKLSKISNIPDLGVGHLDNSDGNFVRHKPHKTKSSKVPNIPGLSSDNSKIKFVVPKQQKSKSSKTPRIRLANTSNGRLAQPKSRKSKSSKAPSFSYLDNDNFIVPKNPKAPKVPCITGLDDDYLYKSDDNLIVPKRPRLKSPNVTCTSGLANDVLDHSNGNFIAPNLPKSKAPHISDLGNDFLDNSDKFIVPKHPKRKSPKRPHSSDLGNDQLNNADDNFIVHYHSKSKSSKVARFSGLGTDHLDDADDNFIVPNNSKSKSPKTSEVSDSRNDYLEQQTEIPPDKPTIVPKIRKRGRPRKDNKTENIRQHQNTMTTEEKKKSSIKIENENVTEEISVPKSPRRSRRKRKILEDKQSEDGKSVREVQSDASCNVEIPVISASVEESIFDKYTDLPIAKDNVDTLDVSFNVMEATCYVVVPVVRENCGVLNMNTQDDSTHICTNVDAHNDNIVEVERPHANMEEQSLSCHLKESDASAILGENILRNIEEPDMSKHLGLTLNTNVELDVREKVETNALTRSVQQTEYSIHLATQEQGCVQEYVVENSGECENGGEKDYFVIAPQPPDSDSSTRTSIVEKDTSNINYNADSMNDFLLQHGPSLQVSECEKTALESLTELATSLPIKQNRETVRNPCKHDSRTVSSDGQQVKKKKSKTNKKNNTTPAVIIDTVIAEKDGTTSAEKNVDTVSAENPHDKANVLELISPEINDIYLHEPEVQNKKIMTELNVSSLEANNETTKNVRTYYQDSQVDSVSINTSMFSMEDKIGMELVDLETELLGTLPVNKTASSTDKDCSEIEELNISSSKIVPRNDIHFGLIKFVDDASGATDDNDIHKRHRNVPVQELAGSCTGVKDIISNFDDDESAESDVFVKNTEKMSEILYRKTKERELLESQILEDITEVIGINFDKKKDSSTKPAGKCNTIEDNVITNIATDVEQKKNANCEVMGLKYLQKIDRRTKEYKRLKKNLFDEHQQMAHPQISTNISTNKSSVKTDSIKQNKKESSSVKVGDDLKAKDFKDVKDIKHTKPSRHKIKVVSNVNNLLTGHKKDQPKLSKKQHALNDVLQHTSFTGDNSLKTEVDLSMKKSKLSCTDERLIKNIEMLRKEREMIKLEKSKPVDKSIISSVKKKSKPLEKKKKERKKKYNIEEPKIETTLKNIPSHDPDRFKFKYLPETEGMTIKRKFKTPAELKSLPLPHASNSLKTHRSKEIPKKIRHREGRDSKKSLNKSAKSIERMEIKVLQKPTDFSLELEMIDNIHKQKFKSDKIKKRKRLGMGTYRKEISHKLNSTNADSPKVNHVDKESCSTEKCIDDPVPKPLSPLIFPDNSNESVHIDVAEVEITPCEGEFENNGDNVTDLDFVTYPKLNNVVSKKSSRDSRS